MGMHERTGLARVAEAFEVTRGTVFKDALLIDAWFGPADDMLARLQAEHRWDASYAVSYVTSIRRVLAATTR